MAKKERIDTELLFKNMIPKSSESEENLKEAIAESSENENNENSIKNPEGNIINPVSPTIKGRKPLKEKNIQVSVYLKPEQAKELRVQDAMKEKENDKSAIARTGLDIVLKMSAETYKNMKVHAEIQNITPGELVEIALKEYFNK